MPGSARSIPTSARQSDAERDREGHIQQDLPRVMHRPLLPPRRQGRRYRLVQPGLADRLDQQHATGLADHCTTAALNADTRIRPDTFLHSPSDTATTSTDDATPAHSQPSTAHSQPSATHQHHQQVRQAGCAGLLGEGKIGAGVR